jgi:hypothetical protein
MGKGRPKGYSPYAEISYEELGDWVGRKSAVKVSRAWLDALRCPSAPSSPIIDAKTPEPEEIAPTIEYNLIDLNE